MSDAGYTDQKNAAAKKVWVIGVEPPCPRCDLMRQRVERLCKELGGNFIFKHSVYTDSESKEFARSLGKKTAKGKELARRAGLNIDWDHVRAIIDSPPSHPEDFDKLTGKASKWSPELDEEIRPCQAKADELGVLLTPILVVDGEVIHHGCVPSLEQLRKRLA